jgi:hypothetical protein
MLLQTLQIQGRMYDLLSERLGGLSSEHNQWPLRIRYISERESMLGANRIKSKLERLYPYIGLSGIPLHFEI